MNAQTAIPLPRSVDAVVLCVDDDDVILDVIQLTLEKTGFSVLTASNWHLALEILRENHIDLVMLDYEMPEMKGHEVAIRIRSFNPEIPILLHSGSPDIPEMAKKVTDAHIRKGVEPYILIATISRLIMNSRINHIHAVRNVPIHS
jgi:CheY-like chemotaxis protein